ncbi:putative AB hydrolase-1 domain-containing protein [Seiridium cardinale]|uniref:AB hydrolase-1 domain-containing protein n=1 Tax=Seiridium cardinale TaxID=138064 RepID=A0ABR2X6H1_9PEZI
MPPSRLVQIGLLLTAKAMIVAASKQCVQFQVPVPVVATNNHSSIPRVDSNIDAVQWALDFSVWNATSPADRNISPYPINQTFNISAQLCVPATKIDKSDILQIAVQGNAWDKRHGDRYWDVQVKPEEHSYVDAAISRGYSILMFDRIGTGDSDIPDAYDVVQVATEIEILTRLTAMARNGTLLSSATVVPTTDNVTVPEPNPKHIVHVGHSFGSLLIAGLLIKNGDMSDAALLTGLLPNSTHLSDVKVATFEHDFAPVHDPVRFGKYASGYIVLTSENTLQKLYFTKDGLEPELLTYTEEIKQPEAVALYVSSGQAFEDPGPAFKGPIQLLVGEFDYVSCNGDCKGTYTEEGIMNSTFPEASNVTVYLQPNTGHALTVAKNASAGFDVMFSYLEAHGF